jgi:basic membrane protein A
MAVDKARADIIGGNLSVVSYYENDSCPAISF